MKTDLPKIIKELEDALLSLLEQVESNKTNGMPYETLLSYSKVVDERIKKLKEKVK